MFRHVSPGRHVALVVGLLALAVAVAAGVAAAHGNHASAGPQVSANGTVVVGQAFLSEPGYAVVTTDSDAGSPRIVGVKALGVGLHSGVGVAVDSSYWAGVDGTVTLRVRLYADDGDGTFEPDSDPVLRWLDQPAGGTFPVRRGPGAVYVVPSGAGSLTADGDLPVARVALAERGHVVVHDATNETLGAALGHRTLDAGQYTNVTVPVERTVTGTRPVTVAVHRDDGDGRFEPRADPVIRVAGTPVATGLSLSTDGRAPLRVNTPTPTTATQPTDTSSATSEGTRSGATTTASGPGVGPLVAAGAVLAGTLVLGRWRRQ